jgi:hypothetical protein
MSGIKLFVQIINLSDLFLKRFLLILMWLHQLRVLSLMKKAKRREINVLHPKAFGFEQILDVCVGQAEWVASWLC